MKNYLLILMLVYGGFLRAANTPTQSSHSRIVVDSQSEETTTCLTALDGKTIDNLSIVSTSNDLQARDNRWKIGKSNSIVWEVGNKLPHYDHIEMGGKQVSIVLRYGVNSDGSFSLNKSLVWPMLRTIPNDTHASLMRRYGWDIINVINVNGQALVGEKVNKVILDGTLTVESEYDLGWFGKCKLNRCYFPSTNHPSLVESYILENVSNRALAIEIPKIGISSFTDSTVGVDGAYRIDLGSTKEGVYYLKPGERLQFSAFISGHKKAEQTEKLSTKEELKKRMTLVSGLMDNLVLNTPDEVIDRMFAFSKIRACESIYETQNGPMHGPGGESYYAAIWANDQAEYVNPYFPYTGYEYGNASALNAFKHFARFMNKDWKPIPSSIVAEGLDIWNGAGDRGDAAMIAYGASRYVLARGIRSEAEELWPLITWCLEYCRLKLNDNGVVASDTDELENRFESGNANLCTSALYYDALLSASYLVKELGKDHSIAKEYTCQAKHLRKNIESYFGATVQGYDTYRYYEGNDTLRSWICIPLTVGIDERKEATLDALFSNHLWTENGLLTQAGSSTFWDRSTLYALRGAFTVGETAKATDFLRKYSMTRLLGEHVPYAIEAWPEGNQRHLSAESGLYGRVITEGLFGIRPTGFRSFSLTPHLPQEWNHMSLKHIRAFNADFNIEINRISSTKIKVIVSEKGKCKTKTIKSGETLSFNL